MKVKNKDHSDYPKSGKVLQLTSDWAIEHEPKSVRYCFENQMHSNRSTLDAPGTKKFRAWN